MWCQGVRPRTVPVIGDRSINRRHVYTKQTEIYQSPACIYEADRDLSIAGMYIRSRQRSNTYVSLARRRPSRPVVVPLILPIFEHEVHHFKYMVHHFWDKTQHFKYKIQHFKYKLTCRPASSACSGACCCWCGNHHVSTEESSFVLKNHWRIIEESSFVLKNHWRIIEESFQSAPESPAFAPRASGTAPVLEATACCYPSK